jgi:branched-chain amino acid transport system ATP-binding protein
MEEESKRGAMGMACALLETKNLTIRFGGLTAVDRADFSLHEGEIRALIGPNGAGKTTFFNLITGVLRPTAGKVIFGGADITKLPAYRRVKLGIGRSYQLVNVFPEFSIRKNIEIAVQAFLKSKTHPFEWVPRKRIKRRTEDTLDRFKWFEDLNVPAGNLIYAEQKKLETLLAIASEPRLLLLDEPSAGVDENDIFLIIEMVKEISRDRTVLITDHDMKFIMRIAERITVMHQGSIIADGPPREIAADPRVNECYFGGDC